jgi:hypothetical protein
MTNNEEFEAYYASTRFDKHSVWKPELNRYTVLSFKQYAWEIWNAARDIPYKFKTGYPHLSESEKE